MRECVVYYTYGPGHEKMCPMPYANNKGADQPAHPHMCFLFSTKPNRLDNEGGLCNSRYKYILCKIN